MLKLDIIIPAAGLGRRMKSYGPKALISIGKEYLINISFNNLTGIEPTKVLTNNLKYGINNNWNFNYTIFKEYEFYRNINLTHNRTLHKYNVTRVLFYNSNGTVQCSNINSCTGDFNVTLAPNNYSYVLENFNVTEFYQRQFSPVWFSSSTLLQNNISSNLTQEINSTIIFNSSIYPCSYITHFAYRSNNSKYNVTYSINDGNLTFTNLASRETQIKIENVTIEEGLTSNSISTIGLCSGDQVPNSGDWNVGSSTICGNGTIILDANMTINRNASLVLRNITLILNNSLYNGLSTIAVYGNLSIIDLDSTSATMNDASNITTILLDDTSPIANTTSIYVYPNANFSIKNSYFSGITPINSKGLVLYTPSIISNNTEYSIGILTILAPANGTNITNNVFKGSNRQTTSIITFIENTTYANITINDITIAYNNFSGGRNNVLNINGEYSNNVRFIHNFVNFTGTANHFSIDQQATNLFVYNNTFIGNGSYSSISGFISYISPDLEFPLAHRPNHTFIDNIFNDTKLFAVKLRTDNNLSIIWLNNTFNYSLVSFSNVVSGGLLIQWYADINITYSDGSIASNVNITLYNSTRNYFTSVISDSDGITRINITEQFLNGANYSSVYNNYTITINSSDPFKYDDFQGSFNLSKLNSEDASTPMLMYNATISIKTLGGGGIIDGGGGTGIAGNITNQTISNITNKTEKTNIIEQIGRIDYNPIYWFTKFIEKLSEKRHIGFFKRINPNAKEFDLYVWIIMLMSWFVSFVLLWLLLSLLMKLSLLYPLIVGFIISIIVLVLI